MSKTIKLYRGELAVVDDDDYEHLKEYRWHITGKSNYSKGYVARSVLGGGQIFMHRVINKTPPGLHTDHINGDSLDNRKINLRTATPLQNSANRGASKHNVSGYKGVIFIDGAWRAKITIRGEVINLGRYRNAKSAADAYKKIDRVLRGDYYKS